MRHKGITHFSLILQITLLHRVHQFFPNEIKLITDVDFLSFLGHHRSPK